MDRGKGGGGQESKRAGQWTGATAVSARGTARGGWACAAWQQCQRRLCVQTGRVCVCGRSHPSVCPSPDMPPDRKWMPGTAAGTLQRHTERHEETGGGRVQLLSHGVHNTTQSGGCAPRTPAHKRGSQQAATAAAAVAPSTLTCASWCVWCTWPHQQGRLWAHPGLWAQAGGGGGGRTHRLRAAHACVR